tara:strand:- start:28981 stop:30243 length:1263 start_codon:yes stop_codon:yes gene_type:complete
MPLIDYNIKSPTDAIMGGLNISSGLNQLEAAKTAAADAEVAKQQMSADINAVMAKGAPSASDFANLTVKYPQFNEQFKQAWDMMGGEQQQNRIGQMTDVYATLEAGNTDVAKQILETQAQAAENSGDERSAKAARALISTIELNPATARTSVGLRLASAMGPEKFTETFTKLQDERREAEIDPATLSLAQSKAKKAAVDADFASSNAATDLQKKGWDIYKIQEDTKIAKENSKIAAITAGIKREQNDLKKQEMQAKLDEMKLGRDAAVREKVAEVESANFNIDNMLNTADRILQTPIGVIDDATGTVDSLTFTLDQDVADFERLIETIDAQAFLSQIPNITGMGALSDAEGKKLAAALQNFSLKQSPKRLMENVREAQRLLLKARANISSKHGVPESIPDTPAVETSPQDLDAILKKHGV